MLFDYRAAICFQKYKHNRTKGAESPADFPLCRLCLCAAYRLFLLWRADDRSSIPCAAQQFVHEICRNPEIPIIFCIVHPDLPVCLFQQGFFTDELCPFRAADAA